MVPFVMENGNEVENIENTDRRGAAASLPTQGDATSAGGACNSGDAWPRSPDTVKVGQQGLRLVPGQAAHSDRTTLPENSVALGKACRIPISTSRRSAF